jgi:large subunit ribosomal protein L30
MAAAEKKTGKVTGIRVKQLKSTTGQNDTFRLTLHGLGLGRIGQEVTVANTPSFRGAIKKVMHMVEVEEVNG